MFFYSDLCSSPRLVYRTGTTPWTKPTGPEAQRQLKELRPVFGHKLNVVWEDLGPKVWQLLDSQGILWTTLLLGTKALDNSVKSIKVKIGRHAIMVELYERQIEKLRARVGGEDEDDAQEATKELKKTQSLLGEAIEAIEDLEKFHDKVMKEWGHPSQRVLGHIARSPPITLGAGAEGFTEDYAVVELDGSKIEAAFKGNVIDLGTMIPPDEFTLKMYPRTDTATTFKYPDDRLLQLRDVMSKDLMHNPDMLDHDNQPCLLVIKNGSATGVTISRATGTFSYVREYFNNNTHQTSMEWAILPYDNNSGVFSAPGDSGSIIADGLGRIGGLLTGGAGKTESSDISYATPFSWLFPRIKGNGFPKANLYPVMA